MGGKGGIVWGGGDAANEQASLQIPAIIKAMRDANDSSKQQQLKQQQQREQQRQQQREREQEGGAGPGPAAAEGEGEDRYPLAGFL